jgi:hypothetical protein
MLLDGDLLASSGKGWMRVAPAPATTTTAARAG